MRSYGIWALNGAVDYCQTCVQAIACMNIDILDCKALRDMPKAANLIIVNPREHNGSLAYLFPSNRSGFFWTFATDCVLFIRRDPEFLSIALDRRNSGFHISTRSLRRAHAPRPTLCHVFRL